MWPSHHREGLLCHCEGKDPGVEAYPRFIQWQGDGGYGSSGNRVGDKAKVTLLVEARRADPGCPAVRERLIVLLTRALVSRDAVDENLLLTLLFEKLDAVPADLLPHLSLEPARLLSLPSASLLALAEQRVTAGRSGDGARVALAAAKAGSATISVFLLFQDLPVIRYPGIG